MDKECEVPNGTSILLQENAERLQREYIEKMILTLLAKSANREFYYIIRKLINNNKYCKDDEKITFNYIKELYNLNYADFDEFLKQERRFTDEVNETASLIATALYMPVGKGLCEFYETDKDQIRMKLNEH